MNESTISNIFGSNGLDREGIRREDEAWIEMQWQSERMRWIAMHGDRQLVSDAPEVVLLDRDVRDSLSDHIQLYFFLGVANGKPVFGINVDQQACEQLAPRGRFAGLRQVATLLPADQANWLAQAQALRHWHETHHYCGRCGKATRAIAAGHARVCVAEDCETRQVFPRMDPAVIVLVHDDDRCLLGRQASWDEHRYSCVAGFVEAGETLEQAVIREVVEETGVHVREPRYHSSQPWPFPQSLMLGFTAEAQSSEIRLHDRELEDARWFTREDIREQLRNGTLKPPSSISISHRLLADWFIESGTDRELLHEADGR